MVMNSKLIEIDDAFQYFKVSVYNEKVCLDNLMYFVLYLAVFHYLT